MPRMKFLLIAVILLLPLFAFGQAQVPTEPLGDVARRHRAAKKTRPTRVITTDDVSQKKSDDVAVSTGSVSQQEPAIQNRDTRSGDAASELEKQTKAYRKQVADQIARVNELERELAVAQREVAVQATSYYMDAGGRLRDPKAWTERREALDKQVAEKQQQVNEARQKLDDLRDEARKMGIAASALE